MVASSESEATLLDALEQDLCASPTVPATQVEDGPHHRRRRVRSEGAVVGGATCDLTLVDSSDDDAPFVVSACSPGATITKVGVSPRGQLMPHHNRSRIREWVESTVSGDLLWHQTVSPSVRRC